MLAELLLRNLLLAQPLRLDRLKLLHQPLEARRVDLFQLVD
jgi:hypothetical protein